MWEMQNYDMYDSMTVWHDDSMTVWHRDSMTVWYHVKIRQRNIDVPRKWQVWQYDSMTRWQYDSMTSCQYDSLTSCQVSTERTWLKIEIGIDDESRDDDRFGFVHFGSQSCVVTIDKGVDGNVFGLINQFTVWTQSLTWHFVQCTVYNKKISFRWINQKDIIEYYPCNTGTNILPECFPS